MAFNTTNIHRSKKLFSGHIYCCCDHLYLSSGNTFVSELQQKVLSVLSLGAVCRPLLLYKGRYCMLLFRAHSERSWIRGAWPCLSVWGRPRSRRSCAGWASSRRAGGGMLPECRRRRSNARGSGTGPSAAVKECTRTREPRHIRTSSAGCLKDTKLDIKSNINITEVCNLKRKPSKYNYIKSFN